MLGSRTHAVVTVVDDTPKSRLHVRITRPFGSVLYTEFTSIRGRATGAGVRRIEVAVTRTAHCDRLGSDRRLHRAADPKTCAPKWLRAKGTSTWKLILPHRLRVGVYKVRVRGIDRKGLTTSVVSRTVSVH